MKAPSDESGFFPAITQDFKREAAAQAAADRREAVARHIESMKCCWEEWDGNEEIKVGTRVEVGECCAPLAEDREYPWEIGVGGNLSKAGDNVYCYMAPAKIVEVVDAETFIAEIQYPTGIDSVENRVSVEWQNGTKLRLDILAVWPPVKILREARGW